jgi:3-hydroxybutyryl-CoA dehydratase
MATDLPPVSDTVTQVTINAYAELSGDFNPLHVDEEVAAASEFGGTIAHGPIALQALFRTLTDGLGVDALPAGSRVAVTYRAPVRPGDAITARAEAPGEDGTRAAACTNQADVTVLSATVTLPE